MKLSIFFLNLSLLFSLVLAQGVVIPTCSTCSMTPNPVCSGGTRYLNPCSATCHGINVTVACPDKKVQDTVIRNGRVCYCPLLEQITCVKNKNSGRYLNPCFAHCENTDDGYGDFESCSGISTAGSNYYRPNVTCNCNNTYTPVCVNGVEYINSCYATCYQSNEAQSSCFKNFNFITQVDNTNCICINSVNPVCVEQRRYANPCLANCAYPGITAFPC